MSSSGGDIQEDFNFRLVEGSFPKVAKNISSFWGHQELVDYIDELLSNPPGVTKQGFPALIVEALVKIWEQHDIEYPKFVNNDTGFWYVDSRGQI